MSTRTKRLKGRTWKGTAQHWHKVAEDRAAEVARAWRKGVRVGQANGNALRRDLQRQLQEERDGVDGLRSQLGIVTRERDEWEANAESVMDTLPRVTVTAEQVDAARDSILYDKNRGIEIAIHSPGFNGKSLNDAATELATLAFRAAGFLIEGVRHEQDTE